MGISKVSAWFAQNSSEKCQMSLNNMIGTFMDLSKRGLLLRYLSAGFLVTESANCLICF